MTIPPPTDGSAALVTGASSGIGLEFARQLAARGHNLVLVARRRDRLEQLAEELREGFGRRVEIIQCDVSDAAAREQLIVDVGGTGLTIDVLILSAGFGMSGPFTGHDPQRVQLMLRTNLEGAVMLTGAFAPAMEVRRTGAILIVSSIAGNQPMPNFGAYAASKAGLNSFAEMLSEELRSSGVTVTVLCPGEVLTEFAQVASVGTATRRIPAALKISAADCARAGLAALDAGQRKVVPRIAVRVLHFVGGHAPRGLWLRFSRRLMA